jgi:hypothetical protein
MMDVYEVRKATINALMHDNEIVNNIETMAAEPHKLTLMEISRISTDALRLIKLMHTQLGYSG